MKRLLALGLSAVLLVAGLPASAAIKAGSACKSSQQNNVSKDSKLVCQKKGDKFIWIISKTAKKIESNPTLTLKELTAPRDFNFSSGSPLRIKLLIYSNTTYAKPELELVFKVDSGKWELPSQEIRLKPIVKSETVNKNESNYTADFQIDSRMPIGKWTLEFADINYGTGQSLKIPNQEINLTRSVYEANDAKAVQPIGNVEYLSFKSKTVERFVWPGKYIAFQTISKEYDPEIMGRIVHTFDKAYESYKEISGYSPSISRQYKNLLVITEMTSEEVGCGAGCGYLGATGIELQSGLFNRLYNGVKLHDQYEQAPFYELGRNFWNYAKYRSVLKGEAASAKWFDASTTGYAVFMRFLIMNINNIPGGPWDSGKGVAWSDFYSGMKDLIFKQRDESGHNFANTFEAGLPPYSGPLSVNDFWSSLLFYFAPKGGEKMFAKSFLANLANRPPATNTASAVQNFVDAMSLTLGKSIDSDFYNTLHFGDARGLVK
jgi:hypothetical protein